MSSMKPIGGGSGHGPGGKGEGVSDVTGVFDLAVEERPNPKWLLQMSATLGHEATILQGHAEAALEDSVSAPLAGALQRIGQLLAASASMESTATTLARLARDLQQQARDEAGPWLGHVVGCEFDTENGWRCRPDCTARPAQNQQPGGAS